MAVGATLVVALPGPSIDAGTKEGTHKGRPYGCIRTTRKMGKVLDGAGMDFSSSPVYIAHSCVRRDRSAAHLNYTFVLSSWV